MKGGWAKKGVRAGLHALDFASQGSIPKSLIKSPDCGSHTGDTEQHRYECIRCACSCFFRLIAVVVTLLVVRREDVSPPFFMDLVAGANISRLCTRVVAG